VHNEAILTKPNDQKNQANRLYKQIGLGKIVQNKLIFLFPIDPIIPRLTKNLQIKDVSSHGRF